MKQLLPLAAAGLVLAACGGVPGNSVATVDGEPIAKTDYDHWNTVVRKLSPGIKPDDARNQALQVLVSFRWVDGEAERLGVKVSDADVRKSFAQQKQHDRDDAYGKHKIMDLAELSGQEHGPLEEIVSAARNAEQAR